MKPWSKIGVRLCPFWALAMVVSCNGCTTPWLFRGQSPDLESALNEESDAVAYVGDLASPWGLGSEKVESIVLVTQLDNTGSDPPPSPQRDRLVAEMQSRQVRKPYEVLASPETSMAYAIAYLPPGIQKGERFDVIVDVPARSETTSLRNGFMMETRMRPMEIVGNGVLTGHVTALAEGPILVDATFNTEAESVSETRGRVLGGGVALQSRPLGLIVRSDANVMTSSMISHAVNQRFFARDRGIKQNVATPKNDRIIELAVPSQYKHNLGRYIRVVRSIALRESASDRAERIKSLENQLLDPSTSSVAALRLEAIGDEAAPALKRGLTSTDPEVRFHAAEALAYAGDVEAVNMLTEAARIEPAFRWHALTALVAMDDVESGEALNQLLHVTSAETRYGAFHAIRTRSPNDPIVQGKTLGDGFGYHVVSTTGEPMIHFSRTRRPEIVLFGADQEVASDIVYVGRGVTIKGEGDSQFKVSFFSSTGDEKHKSCSNRLDELIRAMAFVGCKYSDILDFVRTAKDEEKLDSRLVVDALAKPGRSFVRDEEPAGDKASSPTPELFDFHLTGPDERRVEADSAPVVQEVKADQPQRRKPIFGSIKGWF